MSYKEGITKKGNRYWCVASSHDEFFLNAFENGNKLTFVYGRSKETISLLTVSLKNNTVNVYMNKTGNLRNVSNSPDTINTWIERAVKTAAKLPNDFRRQPRPDLPNGFSNKVVIEGKTKSLTNFVHKWMKSQGVKQPKPNCNKTTVGQLLLTTAYPGLRAFDLHPTHSDRLLNPVTAALRHNTSGYDILQFLTNTKSKQLMKMLQESGNPIAFLTWYAIFGKLWDVNHLIEYAHITSAGGLHAPVLPTLCTIFPIRHFLKQYPAQRMMKMLGANVHIASHNFTDSVRMLYEHRDKITMLPDKPKSLSELHDYLAVEHRKLKHADFDLYVNKWANKVDGVQLDSEHTIVVPRTKYTLIDWGAKMSNCIGSYGDKKATSRQLLGLVKDGQIEYTIECQANNAEIDIRQFTAKRNRPAPSSIVSNFLNVVNPVVQVPLNQKLA